MSAIIVLGWEKAPPMYLLTPIDKDGSPHWIRGGSSTVTVLRTVVGIVS